MEGEWRRSTIGRGCKQLGEGTTGAVEALEQRALTGLGSGKVGGESSTPLLESGHRLGQLGFAVGEGRLLCACGRGPRGGDEVIGAPGQVVDQRGAAIRVLAAVALERRLEGNTRSQG